jgi:hypothetical protein
MSHPQTSPDSSDRNPNGRSAYDPKSTRVNHGAQATGIASDTNSEPNQDQVGNTDDWTKPTTSTEPPAPTSTPPRPATAPDRAAVVARQKERFGGIKAGSAFFGWLTATGMSVLLIALLAAAGVVFGVATNTTVTVDQAVQESEQVTGTAQTVGLVSAITLLVVLLVAYYCGGYVAGRMARFNGAKQGFAVWLWGVVMALVVAAVAAIAGAQYDVFAQLNLPRLPVNEGQVTTVRLITIGAAILAALIGAVLGGLAGLRFHRNVDKAGFDPIDR